MRMQYKVRTVVLTHESTALTLSPVEWYKNTDRDPEEWTDANPSTESTVMEPGGKMTELRIEGESDLRPGDYVSIQLRKELDRGAAYKEL